MTSRTTSERQGDLFAWTSTKAESNTPQPVDKSVSHPTENVGSEVRSQISETRILRPDLDSEIWAKCPVSDLKKGSTPPKERSESWEKSLDAGGLRPSDPPKTAPGGAGGSEVLRRAESDPEVPLPAFRDQPSHRGGVLQPPVEITSPRLRPYQLAAISAVRAEFEAGCRSTLLVLPTGTGKTVVFAEDARMVVRAGGRVLVLAHREELLEQAQSKLADAGVRAELEQAKKRASSTAPVVVASIATLQRQRLTAWPREWFARIVVDEAHHAAAQSYGNILEYFSTATILGVTATPARADGKALKTVFASVAYRYELRDAIRDKWLVPLRAKRVVVGAINLTNVRTHHGDLDQRELSEILTVEKVLHETVGPLVEQAGDRPTIVFAVDVAHAHALADMLNRYRPGSALAVDGSAKREDRRAALASFRRGEIQFLCNCALYTEGFDEPSIECVAICRPTKSWALYVQMLGRGTRLSEITGKRDCLILDFVGNSGRHRLIGPADALAGGDVELSDEVRAEVAEQLDGARELDQVLENAELEISKRGGRLALIAAADYRTKEIDPFLGDFFVVVDPNGAWSREPATAKQRSALKAGGLDKVPDLLTKGEASKWLDAIAQRRSKGLASVAAARCLKRAGLDVTGMLDIRAKDLIQKLRRNNWRPWVLAGEPEFRRKDER